MAPRQSEVFVLLYDSNYHPDEHNNLQTPLFCDASGRLHHSGFPIHFSYEETEITIFNNRVYQIRFNGSLPKDELGEKMKEITGTIVTDTDENGNLHLYIANPRIVYEHEPSPNKQPYAVLLTPYPGMEIFDTVTEEVIFSIPAGE